MPLSQFLGTPAPPAAPKIDFIKPITPEQQRTYSEFFNILNHTNFIGPNFLNGSQNNSVFDFNGSALPTALNQTSTSSRQIQLGLKLIW